MSTEVPPSSIDVTITPKRKGSHREPDSRGLKEADDIEVSKFDAPTLALVLDLLDYRDGSPEKLDAEKEVRRLFQYWKVTAWDDLISFSGTDVLEALSVDTYTGILQNLKTKKLLASRFEDRTALLFRARNGSAWILLTKSYPIPPTTTPTPLQPSHLLRCY